MILREPRPKVVLSLTPLIDVVFILLIFFMLASQFSEWRQIKLMPQAEVSGVANDETAITLHLLNNGTFRLGSETFVGLSNVVENLSASPKESTIFLSTDDAVQIQRVVDVVERLAIAGMSDLRLLEEAGSTVR